MVSVIMPAYNSGRTVEESINSVLNQTYKDFEIIVVNDCSTDNTAQIVTEMVKKDKRIKFYNNPENCGVSKTRNFAISQAKGEWIAFLDSDDLWRETKLELQLELADKEGADIVYSSYSMVDINGEKKCNDFIVSPVTDFEKMLVRNEIGCLTAMVKTEVMKNYTFSGDFAHEDYVLWMSILKSGCKAAGHTSVLADYRVYPGTRSANKFRAAKNRWLIYRNNLGLSVFKSFVSLVKYMFNGLKKYKSA